MTDVARPARRSRRPDGADTRRRMLEAGTKLASDLPFAHVTVQHVTDLAGTGRATFYLYFDNIDAFFIELGRESCEALVEAADQAWTVEDPHASFEAFVRGYVGTFRRHDGVLGVCYSKRFQSPGFSELLVGTRGRIIDGFARTIQAGGGRFASVDARLVADALVCMVEALSVHELDDGRKGSLDHVVSTVSAIWSGPTAG